MGDDIVYVEKKVTLLKPTEFAEMSNDKNNRLKIRYRK
jgi:hypothetical protein